MQWPNEFLLVLLCLSAVAVIVPWLIPRDRRGLLSAFIAAVAATACWVSYENKLHMFARPGDPLIRIDLLLIVPLIALDWLSAIASLAAKRLRRRNA